MKYIGHVLTLIGAGLVAFGYFNPWLEVGTINHTANGNTLTQGHIALATAGLGALMTILAFLFKRRALVISESFTALVIFGMLAWTVFFPKSYVGADYAITLKMGFWYTFLGAAVIQFGALWSFAKGPVISRRSRPLRVAALWNGTVISEQIFDEPHNVTIGENTRKATIPIPEGTNIKNVFKLFSANPVSGKYTLGLTREMTGTLMLGGKRYTVDEAIATKTSNRSGGNTTPVSVEDWGIIHTGPMAIFFQFIEPERKAGGAILGSLDSNLMATSSFSFIVHVGLVLAMLFMWTEDETIKRRPVVFKSWDVAATYDMEEIEEEEEDEGEEEETTAKRAEGDEGKFGDPDIDPMVESIVPERDGKMVSKIDPKNVGLNDLLSTKQLGGRGAIANIFSKDTSGVSNKLAVAMAGAGSEFVMGHGSGGMGFKGTGTGGGGLGGYGRIHGLGKIDTGGGTGMHGSLGRKRARKVGKIKIGSGTSAGYCKKGDIARAVRRRANSIRACYEQRLQVKPGLSGKVTARWTIGLDGRVKSASVQNTTMGDGAVTSCILRVIRRIGFAKPEGGVCIVQWPFVFNPSG